MLGKMDRELLMNVKLADFANQSGAHRLRVKKISLNSIVTQVETMSLEDEKLWYEKSYEDDDLQSPEEKEDDCPSISVQHRKGRRRKRHQEDEAEEEGGVEYPVDVWFSISKHLRPEDIGRFASICKTTYIVVASAHFWLNLYERYFQWRYDLPESLDKWNMRKRRGLRAGVIRALFFIYPPYIQRISSERPLSADPSTLIKNQCILQWHKVLQLLEWKDGLIHKYYFKFEERNYFCKQKNKKGMRLFGSLEGDPLVHSNNEEGCRIMEVCSKEVSDVGMIIGEYLIHAGLGISPDLSSNRLRLCVGPAHALTPVTSSRAGRRYYAYSKEVLLNGVQDLKIFPWWHPQYWQCGAFPQKTWQCLRR
ncbi:transmembrane protein fates-shifted isoform X1 [Oratosquilla oratoria]|uniref:transmembrane protein fates-shifted isoform X1 n=1 Tax=Oratosquilla oratoria TaxID=337810 RepID=UPI003F762C2D